MKVFLSWSGEVSQKVATALHDWLPYIIQAVQPFISSGDISKGDRWRDALDHELKDAEYGIICVTPYNIHKPWMNFEAGVLSKFIERSCVAPFLFNVERSLVTGPLSQFQATSACSEDDVFNLVYTINSKLGSNRLEHDLLRKTFDIWWKELSRALASIVPGTQEETQTFYKWLYTLEDVGLHEVKPDCVSVWIITSELFKFALEPKVKQKLIANLTRGVKYRYFLGESNEIKESEKEEFFAMVAKSSGNLECKNFAKECFDSEAVTDYIIINADCEASHPLEVFLKIPIATVNGEYWIKVDDRSALGFKSRFQSLWDDERKLDHAIGVNAFRQAPDSGAL